MKSLSFCLLLGILAVPLQAEDWPRFRGPHGNNALPDAKIATSFPASGPKVRWSIEVNPGYGGAAIVGDEVFFLDRVDQERDVLRCVGLEDGKERWKWEHEVAGRISHPGSRGVPTVTEDAVYASSGFGHVYCIDRKTHKERWVFDVAKTFGVQPPRFGYSIHPVLVGDHCIIAPTGDEVGLAALDRKTGKVVWKTEGIGESHSSPLLINLLDKEMVVMPGSSNGTLMLSGFDPKSGKELFRYSERLSGRRHNSIPNIAVVDRDTVFLTGGYGQGTQVLQFSEGDGAIKVERSKALKAGARIHPVLVIGEKLFLTAEGAGRGGRNRRNRGGEARPETPAPEAGAAHAGLVCMAPDGEVLWSTKTAPGFGEGSILNAGGILISQDGGDGTLRLIKPGPSYQELASGKVFRKEPGRELWAPMALSRGNLVMRSQNELVCVDLSP